METAHFAPLPALLDGDKEWGIATLRQRILLRLAIGAAVTEEFGHLEALGATLGAAAAKLRALWPPEAEAMPYYPAFR